MAKIAEIIPFNRRPLCPVDCQEWLECTLSAGRRTEQGYRDYCEEQGFTPHWEVPF